MSEFQVTAAQLAQFERDGYIVVPKLFNAEEMDLLLKTGRADRELNNARGMRDAAGGVSKLSLRTNLRRDIYSSIAHCRRVVDAMEKLLGGEVYHIHHKMMLKEPFVGGAWEWHQDYGYWYNDVFLYPQMASCMIAVDKATRENGCLEVLKASHHMGRLNHDRFEGREQRGAQAEHVEAAMKRLDLIYCEMDPGTALFFHGNLLHRSAQNTSPNPRWSLICCYSRADNEPHKAGAGNPKYSKLEKWPDSGVAEIGREQLAAIHEQVTEIA